MNDDVRAHSMVLRWIEGQFLAGLVGIGDRLPPERTLADSLSVSRTSVREAIRILEAMGIVRVGVGSGPEAGTVVTADPAGALTSALRLHVATAHLPVPGIVETRKLLETWSATHSRPDSPALRDAASILQGMQFETEPEGYLDLDAKFHGALVKAADNVVVDALTSSLHDSIRGYTTLCASLADDWEDMRIRLQKEHELILDAFLRGQRGSAANLVAEHIDNYYNHTRISERGT
jgi:GntR family transcriptional repressor for pyruvate dehydrogenase complex